METWLVTSIAERYLEGRQNYQNLADISVPRTDTPANVTLRDNESLIGIYRNVPDKLQDAIVITNMGLHVNIGDYWESIGFDDIIDIDGPATKEEISGVTLTRIGGTQTYIPVSGARDQFRGS